jgi:AraC-like DNA-binding protein
MARTQVDGLWMGQVCSSAGVVHHGREQVARTRVALYFLHMQLEGRSRNTQEGRVAELQAGDFTLLDSTRPYQLTFDSANKTLVLGIPEALLRRQLPGADRLVAVRMPGELSLNQMLLAFARNLWQLCELNTEILGGNLSSALCNLTAAAYGRLAGEHSASSAHMEAMRVRVLQYIERHLCDCDLSPKSIAANLAVSARYIHSIFTRGEETVSRYILRRRLEDSAQVLASAAQRSRSVSAIAFDHGFSSCTNFGKVFREHFGMTPTEYRLQHSQPSARTS